MQLEAIGAAALAAFSVTHAAAQTDVGGGLGTGVNRISIGSSPSVACATQPDSAYRTGGGTATTSSGAVADGAESIAIGGSCAYPSAAIGASAVAMGANAYAFGDYSFALGRNAKATVALAQAWGLGSNASGINSVAIGSASVVGGVAQNDAPSAAGADSIALGRAASVAAYAPGGVAIGLGSVTQLSGGTAIGSGAKVIASGFRTGEGVIDRRAGNGGSSDVALPTTGATTSFGAGIAIGSTTAYDGSVSVGFNNLAGDTTLWFRAVALGTENLVNGAYSTGLGIGNTASGIAAVALGVVNQATGNTSIAIGRQSYALGDFSIAQGNLATASDVNAISIGNSSGATAKGAIAIGGGSDGSTSLLDPTGSLASGVGAIAIGTATRATGSQSISIGTGNVVAGNNSGAFGDPSYINADSAYGIGNNNTINAAGSFVLGNNVTVAAGLDGAVVLGNNSTVAASNPTAGVTIAGQTYNFAGASPAAGGVVSVGAAGAERQVINVAAGRISGTSTDAINGSQLFAANQAIDSLSTALGNVVGNTTINGTGVRYVRTNENGLAPSDAFAAATGATAVGYNATSSAAGAVAIGRDSSASVSGGVALGQGSVSDRAINPGSGTVPGFAAVQYNTTNGTLLGAVSLGSAAGNTYRQITNLADGTQGQDAASVAQLQALSGTLSNTSQKYFHANSTAADSLSVGAESIAVGPKTVVNGDSAIGIGDGATVQMVATGGTAIGQAASVGQVDGIALGTQASADAARGVAIGAGASVTHADSVALGAGAVTSIGSRTGYAAFAVTTPQNSAGEVSVGRAGAERQITNVAAGSADTDAVNVSQLRAVAAVTNNAVQYDDAGKTSITLGGPTSSDGGATGGTTITNLHQGAVVAGSTDAVNGSQLYTVQQQVNNLNNGTAGFFQVNNTSNLSAPIVSGSNAAAGGAGAVALGTNSTALGNGASALASNSVALGAGSVADRAGSVSVGAAGAERQVVNVAAGTAVTDAVNVGQLQAAQTGNVQYDKNADGSTNYSNVTFGNGNAPNGVTLSNVAPGVKGTDAVNVNQLNGVRDSLNGRIDDVAKNAYAGVAAAMAVQMPASYVPGKTVMRIGASVFKGQSAVGLSFRRTSENNAFSVTGGVGASRAGTAATVGAEWVFN